MWPPIPQTQIPKQLVAGVASTLFFGVRIVSSRVPHAVAAKVGIHSTQKFDVDASLASWRAVDSFAYFSVPLFFCPKLVRLGRYWHG